MAVPDDVKQVIYRMWGEGKSALTIGRELGLTKNQCIGIIHRAGLSRDKGARAPVRTRQAAPIELRQRAVEMRASGMTWEAVGDQLAVDRKTAAKWARTLDREIAREARQRVSLSKGSSPVRKPHLRLVPVDTELKRIEDPRQIELPLPLPEPPPPTTVEASVPHATHVLTIDDLSLFMCRDVTLSPDHPGGLYCGAPVTGTKSYCPHHHAMYYEKPRKEKSKERLYPIRRSAA